MSIKQNGGVFGRNPTFNDLTIEGDLILNGEIFTGLDFQGSWNASTNSPSLASSTGTNGEFYIVSVAGTTNLNGITNWGIGDWAIFNGTVWQRVEGGADGNFDALTANSLVVTGTSYIQSTTAPQLELAYNSGNITGFYRSGGDFQIKNDNGAGSPETSIVLAEDGAVTLYHDANPKIATTSSGVKVGTGTTTPWASADDLVVNGTTTAGVSVITPDSNNGRFVIGSASDTDYLQIEGFYNSGSPLGRIRTGGNIAMTFDNSQNVTIPAGNLDVTGTATMDGLTVNGADAVGIDDYVLHNGDSNTKFGFSGNDAWKIRTGGVDAVTVDASQNVNIPAGNLTVSGVDVNITGNINHIGDSDTYFGFHGNDLWRVVTGGAERLEVGNSGIRINDGGADMDFTIESSGNANMFVVDGGNNRIGVGTGSPSRALDVSTAGSTILANFKNTGGTTSHITLGNTTSTADQIRIGSDGTALTLATAYTEGLRIDGSQNVSIPNGYLLVGTSSIDGDGLSVKTRASGGSTTTQLYFDRADTTTTGFVAVFANNGVTAGSISHDHDSTAFNTSSDYRLKEDWQPMSGATDRLKALNPVNFAWKSNGSRVDGFLAHEAQEVVPESVTGSKDAMMTKEYEVSPATGDIYTPEVVAVEGVEAVEYVAPQDEVLDEEGNVVTEAVAEVMAVEAVEAVEGVAEVIHSADVEQPSELEDGQLWRETTAQVMGEREVPDYQGIDQAKLVPLLVATIQELEARITALES